MGKHGSRLREGFPNIGKHSSRLREGFPNMGKHGSRLREGFPNDRLVFILTHKYSKLLFP